MQCKEKKGLEKGKLENKNRSAEKRKELEKELLLIFFDTNTNVKYINLLL